jgi:hypothetical protein
MKLRTTLYSFAAVLLLGSIFLAGCTTEDSPGTGSDGITRTGTPAGTAGAEDHMTVTGFSDGQRYAIAVKGGAGTVIKGLSSNGSGSIVVTWTRGGTDAGIDSIFAKKVDNATTSLTVDGTVYTAQTWATSTMFGPITVSEDYFDNGTSGRMSGFTVTSTGLTQVSTKSGADVSNYDFRLHSLDKASGSAPWLVLEPGIRNNINDARKAEMALNTDVYVVGGGASRDYYSSGFLTQTTFSTDNFYTIPAVDDQLLPIAVGANTMIPVKIKQTDGTTHYARIEIVSALNKNGVNGLWHEPDDQLTQPRTITVNVYYQTVADWDYATPHDAGNSGH